MSTHLHTSFRAAFAAGPQAPHQAIRRTPRAAACACLIAAFCLLSLTHTPARADAADATEPLALEAVARLYMKTFINDDAAAGRALNDYLKPAFAGQDVLNIALLGQIQQMTRDGWERNLPNIVAAAPAQERANVTAGLRSAFAAGQWQAKQAQCEVDRVLRSPSDKALLAGDQPLQPAESAQVDFSCRIPTASAQSRAALTRATEANDGRGIRRHAQAFLAEVKSGRFSTTVSGSQTLRKRPGASGRWIALDNSAWLTPVQNDMP